MRCLRKRETDARETMDDRRSTSEQEKEDERLAALASFQIFDTPPEDEFDFLARLAADFCGTSMAGITLIGSDRQFYKSAIGMSVRETPRDESFCQYTVSTQGPVVVEDASADERFRDSPLVAGDPGIRFYAGAPLVTGDGHVLGALCVMDREPHAIDPGKLKTLEGLARQASALLERRRGEGELSKARLRLGHGERVAHLATWHWDLTTGNGSHATVEWDRILGREPGTVDGLERFLERVVDDDRGRVAGTIEAALASGTPLSYRARIRRPDGEIRTIDTEAEPQLDEHGELVGFRGATVDVTELVRAEARSREQANGLRAAFQTALDAMFVFDDRRAFTHVNPAACELLGYQLAELLAMGVGDVISDRTRPQAESAFSTLAEKGKLRGELELERADGTPVLAEFAATRDFRPGLHLAILRDITERERADNELRMQANVLDEVPAGIVAADAERKLTQWSRGAEELFGVPRHHAISRRFSDLGLIPPASSEVRQEMERCVGGGETWEGEIELRGAGGRVFPALVTASPVRDRNSEVVGFVGVIVDLSDQRRAALELRRSRLETIRRLARAVEMRDHETGGHIDRIGAYAAVIARRLEIESERVDLLQIAAPMHDVGKIGISDSVLLKPGRLTNEERAQMERHAEIGHRILAGSGSLMLELAATIALSHHEWMDGSGYPGGLSGGQIPIEGRIVAVADVFDALTSDRVYRPAFSVEEAVEMMRAERGTHFDPEVLDAMLAELDAILAIRRDLDNGGGRPS